MHYVILRDDDTNALTPVECLERLYRPFLDRGMPVNLATIPDVSTSAKRPDGKPEGFLFCRNGETEPTMSITSNPALLDYLRSERNYKIVQHGLHHQTYEFDLKDVGEISRRLESGTRLLREAGLGESAVFVAPHDRFSRASLAEVARRFAIVSSGWYELSRLPYAWWPSYALKKMRAATHWKFGSTLLLTHPGCLLSRYRPRDMMFQQIQDYVTTHRLTVLVTHWWEYFAEGIPDAEFIGVLHRTAEYLSETPGLRVVSFDSLLDGGVQLN